MRKHAQPNAAFEVAMVPSDSSQMVGLGFDGSSDETVKPRICVYFFRVYLGFLVPKVSLVKR